MSTHPCLLVPCITTHIPPWEWLGGLKILRNLDPHIWWSVVRMEGISVYKLHPRHVRPYPRLHKRCEMYQHPSIATCTSYNISHIPGDGVVVCWQILQNLGTLALDGTYMIYHEIQPYIQVLTPLSIYQWADTPLLKQQSKGITSILTKQYHKDGPAWMKEN